MSKTKELSINISTTSLMRVRCKICGKINRVYIDMIRNSALSKPSKIKISINRSAPNFIDTRAVMDATIKTNNAFSPEKYKNTKSRATTKRLIEYAYCNCFGSKFSVQEQDVKSRIENVNRRGKYGYPHSAEC